MSEVEWLAVPVGIDAHRWVSRVGCRNVLVVVHTVTSCHRLLDVVDLVETDPRVQVVFTVAPDAFNHGVARFLDRLDALVLPWHQAARSRFDLALAAAYGGLPELHAPIVVMPHGAGRGKEMRTDGGVPTVYGLDAPRLTRDGRVLPAALVLANERELDVLRRQCPEAVPVAVVAGDPCYDRLVASLPHRRRYRASLGLATGDRLVVISSTWSRNGLFGHSPDLLPELMAQLSAGGYRVAALIHPAVWSAHGHRQVRAWLRDCHEAGLLLPDPEQDWRALVIAADRVLGDQGSVTAYAAAIGRRVLHLGPVAAAVPAEGTAQDLVAAHAARLDPHRPLFTQVRAARPVDRHAVTGALTSRPGRSGHLLRGVMYRLMGLAEPGRHRRVAPVPEPLATTDPRRSAS
jgi:hypothetical protein